MTVRAIQWLTRKKVPKARQDVRWTLSAVRDAITSAGRPDDDAVAAEVAAYARALELVVSVTRALEKAPVSRERVAWKGFDGRARGA